MIIPCFTFGISPISKQTSKSVSVKLVVFVFLQVSCPVTFLHCNTMKESIVLPDEANLLEEKQLHAFLN